MDDGAWVIVFVVAIAIVAYTSWYYRDQREQQRTPEERESRRLAQQDAIQSLEWGPCNEALVCPHCQVKGNVRAKPVERKKGISGGKVAAAILLSPVTLLATGISRQESATQAHCGNCSSTWDF